ncbi:MAG: hypothetical protein LBC35_03985 [Coriobacteriales bacterium]|jgi:hypothetical protein|nr:hypothetical protein [Coriobacteriales bacterium]
MENPFKFEYETDLDIATCREIMTPEYFERQRKSDTHFYYKTSRNLGLGVGLKKNGTITLDAGPPLAFHMFKVKLRSEQGKTIIECRYSSYINSLFANYWLTPIVLLLSFIIVIFIPEPSDQMIKFPLCMMLFSFLLLSGIPEVFRYNTSYKIVTDYLEVALQAKRVPK